MKFEFYDHDCPEVTEELLQYLWDQGICMDDWDYMLFWPKGFETWMDDACHSNGWEMNIRPKNDQIDRLLVGCCSNKWYMVNDFMGRKGILGVAYHA